MVRNKNSTITFIIISLLLSSCTGGLYSLDKCYEEVEKLTDKLNSEMYVWYSNVQAYSVNEDDKFKAIAMHQLKTDYILDIENGPFPIKFNIYYEGKKGVSLLGLENHLNDYKENIADIYYLKSNTNLIDVNYANQFSNFIVKYNDDPYFYAFVLSAPGKEGRKNIKINPGSRTLWDYLLAIYERHNIEFNAVEFLVDNTDTLERFNILDIKFGENYDEEFSLNKYTDGLEYRKELLNDFDYLFKSNPECLEIEKFKGFPTRIKSDYQNIINELSKVSSEYFEGPTGFLVPIYSLN